MQKKKHARAFGRIKRKAEQFPGVSRGDRGHAAGGAGFMIAEEAHDVMPSAASKWGE